ncbi:hypothetical protein L083_3368 [Actinoplanes sp. N902-109]|nr:hypothetical protein L083_3368 [Actinoplanes sp. N902-109]
MWREDLSPPAPPAKQALGFPHGAPTQGNDQSDQAGTARRVAAHPGLVRRPGRCGAGAGRGGPVRRSGWGGGHRGDAGQRRGRAGVARAADLSGRPARRCRRLAGGHHRPLGAGGALGLRRGGRPGLCRSGGRGDPGGRPRGGRGVRGRRRAGATAVGSQAHRQRRRGARAHGRHRGPRR